MIDALDVVSVFLGFELITLSFIYKLSTSQ